MGMSRLKKLELLIIVLCVLVLAAPIIKTPETHAQNSPEVNQLLDFFREVLLIDTSRCCITGGPLTGPGYDNRPEMGTRGICEGKITLLFDSGGSVDSLFEFKGRFLVWCLIYYDAGNTNPIPYIRAPPGDHLEMARDFLERYETFTDDSRIADMKRLLDAVNKAEPLSKTEGNLNMTITVRNVPDFEWAYTFEEEEYSLLRISFFGAPHIFSLGDQRYKYNMNNSAFPSYEPLTVDPSFGSEHTFSSATSLFSSGYAVLIISALAASGLFGFALLTVAKRRKQKTSFSIQLSLIRDSVIRKALGKKRIRTFTLVLMILFSMGVGLYSVGKAEANFLYPPLEKIYIKADGSISPPTRSIIRTQNGYTFVDNLSNYALEVQCNNIVINGAGYYVQKIQPAYLRTDALALKGVRNVTITNLDIRGFDYGVYLSNSQDCQIIGNEFSGNQRGIVLADHSTGNMVSGNSFSSGGGIGIYYSTNNSLRSNVMSGSGPHLWVDCENVTSPSDFMNDIDETNTINDKPVYYWINQHDRAVPLGAGYVALVNCSGIMVKNLNLTNNGQGVLLISTKNAQVTNNSIAANNKGIAIYGSPDNNFTSNNITSNTNGIVSYSRPNTFRSNRLDNNTFDANFEDRFFDEFDRSNLVDGTPICYWLWQHDKTVPVDSGYVVLLSCQNITVQNLNLTGRRQALYFSELTDSLIMRNIITNNEASIVLKGSSNNKIRGNLVANNTDGIYMEAAQSNELSGNKITFNINSGIYIDDGFNNTIIFNYIAHCKIGFTMNRGGSNTVSGNTIIYTKEKGAHIGASADNIVTGNNIAWSKGHALSITGTVGNNVIHHNDFGNNAAPAIHQAYPGGNVQNTWDDRHEGNFWSDYQNKYPQGKETASGIWDTPIVMNENNTDRFPLTKPVNMKYQVTILQPASAAYNASAVPLVFFATGPVSWMGYSIDGNTNVTANGDFLLANLHDGIHAVTVYAGDERGVCASETITFEIAQNTTTRPTSQPTERPSQTIKPSASFSPSLSPTLTDQAVTPTSTDNIENPVQISTIATWLILGAIVVSAALTVTLLIIRWRKAM
jgi:parallel beta-helix repeat protein